MFTAKLVKVQRFHSHTLWSPRYVATFMINMPQRVLCLSSLVALHRPVTVTHSLQSTVVVTWELCVPWVRTKDLDTCPSL